MTGERLIGLIGVPSARPKVAKLRIDYISGSIQIFRRVHFRPSYGWAMFDTDFESCPR